MVLDMMSCRPCRRSERQKLEMLAGIARGFRALQAADPPILHRDIKGDNILVSKDGRPMISDFGLAREHRPEWEKDYSAGRRIGNKKTMVIPAAAKLESMTVVLPTVPCVLLVPITNDHLVVCKPEPAGVLLKLLCVCKMPLEMCFVCDDLMICKPE